MVVEEVAVAEAAHLDSPAHKSSGLQWVLCI